MSLKCSWSSILFIAIWFANGDYECTHSDTWIELPPLPIYTSDVASIVMEDNLYVVGRLSTETYKYSLIDNIWVQVADRIYEGSHHGSILFKNEWWLIGGISDHSEGTVQIYNPNTNTWRTNVPLPWDGGAVCVALINNIIYACGGIQGFNGGANHHGTNTSSKCATLDPLSNDKKWKLIQKMPAGRNNAATGSDHNGNLWIFGGQWSTNEPSTGDRTVQMYSTLTDTWKTSSDSELAPMTIGKGGMGNAVYLEDAFYIFGGNLVKNYGEYILFNPVYDMTDIYDITKNEWSLGKSMQYPREGIFPILYKNAIYIAAGSLHSDGHNVSNKFDKYCLKEDDNPKYFNKYMLILLVSIGVFAILLIIGVILFYKWYTNRTKKMTQFEKCNSNENDEMQDGNDTIALP